MPSRNYAIIAESTPSGNHNTTSPPTQAPTTQPSSTLSPGSANGDAASAVSGTATHTSSAPDRKANTRKPMHVGEQGAGTGHPAAQGVTPTGLCGPYGLDVTLRVEISNSDKEGRTDGYGFSVPGLEVGSAYVDQGTRW